MLSTTYANKEIVVADNGSTDDSIEFLKQKYPGVTIVQLPINYGFAKGYNEALKHVQADYYMILNSDVEVTPGWIEPMVEMLEANKEIVACQPKILSYQNKSMFDYAGAAGGWIDKYGYPFGKGRVFDLCEVDNGQYNRSTRIFWVSGAAMFIRSSTYHEMKGFDEFFFAHQEEIDLCWRIQLAGYALYSCPSSVVYHLGGGTLPRGNSRKTYLNFRNNQIMLAKNLPWSQKWWKIPYRQMLDVLSALKGLFSGDGGYFIAIARAHISFAKWMFFYKRKSVFPKKRTGKLYGVYDHNLVWDYFVKKKKHFSEIIEEGL